MVARCGAPPSSKLPPIRIEATDEVRHRALHIGEVAGEHDLAVDAFRDPRRLLHTHRAAHANVADRDDGRRLTG